MKEINKKISVIDTASETFLKELSDFYAGYSIGLVTDEKSCNFLNTTVEESNIRETLTEPVREVYFKIKDHYSVMFIYEECVNCVQLGKLPYILIINETGGIKEVKFGE